MMHGIDAALVPSVKLVKTSWQPFSLLKLAFVQQLHFPLTLFTRIRGLHYLPLYYKIRFIC